MSSGPHFYILTRTSGRRHFFHQNYLSVRNQSYPHKTQIVSYDHPETEKYVLPYCSDSLFGHDQSDHQLLAFSVKKPLISEIKAQGAFPFNLYLNELMDQVLSRIKSGSLPHGWILFLDDDDLFTDQDALQIIADSIDSVESDSEHFLMWQVEFPNRRIIPRRFGRRDPVVGDVSMIGFSFHTELISRVRFKNKKGGDYLMIKLLSEHLEPVWIEHILTKINYIQNRTIGSGKQNDLHFSVAQVSEYKLFLENKMKRQTQRRNITIVKKPIEEEFDDNQSLVIPESSEDSSEKMNNLENDSFEESLEIDSSIDLSSNLKKKLKGMKEVAHHTENTDNNDIVKIEAKSDDQVTDTAQVIQPQTQFQQNQQIQTQTQSQQTKVEVKKFTKRVGFKDEDSSDHHNGSTSSEDDQPLNEEDDAIHDSDKEVVIGSDRSHDDDVKEDRDEDREDEDREDDQEDNQEDREDREDENREDEPEDDQERETGDETRSEMILHPQIERLLDAITDQKRVQIITIDDFKRDLKEELSREIGREVRKVLLQHLSQLTQINSSVVDQSKMTLQEQIADLEKADQKSGSSGSKKTSVVVKRSNVPISSVKTGAVGGVAKTGVVGAAKTGAVGGVAKTVSTKAGMVVKSQTTVEKSGGGSFDEETCEEHENLNQLIKGYVDSDQGEDLAVLDRSLDGIYIFNYTDKAQQTMEYFINLGFTNVKIVEFNKKKKDFWSNLFDLLRTLKKRGEVKKIGVFLDNIHPHKDFVQEMLFSKDKFLKSDWKLLVAGAAQNLTMNKSGAIDWKYYLDTYADLRKSGRIKDEITANKHYKTNGVRENRFSQHGVFQADILSGVSGVFVSSKLLPDLEKLQKARDPRQFLLQNYQSSIYAYSPLLSLSDLNRIVKMRNRHNLEFYDSVTK